MEIKLYKISLKNVFFTLLLINLTNALKSTQNSFLSNKQNEVMTNFDKIIITPPFLPEPEFAMDNPNNFFNNQGQYPSSSYNNFRFKDIQPNTQEQIYQNQQIVPQFETFQDKSEVHQSIPVQGKPQEEYVFVPTPVDYDQYIKMQYSKDFSKVDPALAGLQLGNNNMAMMEKFNMNQMNGNATEFPLIDPKYLMEYANNLSLEHKFQQPAHMTPIENSNLNNINQQNNFFDGSTMKFMEIKPSDNSLKIIGQDPTKFIKAQEDEYQKYFEKINQFEYEKVYNSLNDNQKENEINDKIKISEGNIDFNEIWNNFRSNPFVNSTSIPNDLANQKNIHNITGYSQIYNDLPGKMASTPSDIQNYLNAIKLESATFASNSGLNFTNNMVISLPQNNAQIQDLYQNFFKKINQNNTFAGISLLQETNKEGIQKKTEEEIKYEKVDYPSEGLADTKPVPVQPKTIGIDITKQVGQKPLVKEDPEKIKIELNAELIKREFEPFPRNKNLRPYEKKDLEENKIRQEIKKREFEKNKKKFAKGFSFLQKQDFENSQFLNSGEIENLQDGENHNQMNSLDKLVKADLAEHPSNDGVGKFLNEVHLKIIGKKLKIKENLINCKRNCGETCNRVISLGKKDESIDLCKSKCELACSNNALNILLK